MATFAARKLGDMADNTAAILAIELLAAAQGVDHRAPHRTSPALRQVMAVLRGSVPHYDLDRYFAPDIAVIKGVVQGGGVARFSPFRFSSEVN
jgi:histidine ammonia-lyase